MMKTNFVENWMTGTGATGTVLASVNFAMVKDVLTIVFLCIQIFVLILGITIKFFKYYGDGKLSKEEQDDLLNDLDKINDVINKEDQKK